MATAKLHDIPVLLPPKADRNPYTMEELLNLTERDSEFDFCFAYEDSFRFVLALQNLERVVRDAVDDPKQAGRLLPRTKEEFDAMQHHVMYAHDVTRDYSVEKTRLKNGDSVAWASTLRKLTRDPLSTARNYVVAMLEPESRDDRIEMARDVQRLMVLMAENMVYCPQRTQETGRGT